LMGNRMIIASASRIIRDYYLNVTSNYAGINSIGCICQSGTCWNTLTMRCYNLTFSLQ
jgi:hypothetical protein